MTVSNRLQLRGQTAGGATLRGRPAPADDRGRGLTLHADSARQIRIPVGPFHYAVQIVNHPFFSTGKNRGHSAIFPIKSSACAVIFRRRGGSTISSTSTHTRSSTRST
jgi:hypothetical protein